MENTNSQTQLHRYGSDEIRGNLLMFIATLFFGVNIPVVKSLIPEWMSANDVTIFRIVGSCILFWIVSLVVKTQRLERYDLLRVLIGGGLGLFLFLYLFNLSLLYADPIDVSIIMTLPPAFVVIFNMVFRHSRSSFLELAGLFVSFVGAILVIVVGHADPTKASDALLGNLLAVASSAAYAGYLIVMAGPTKKYNTVSLLRWVFLAAAMPTLLLVGKFSNASIWIHGHAEQWLMIAFVVICPTFISYMLINPSIKLIGGELVSIYQYLMPVIATIASVIMGIASVRWIQIIAIVAIIAGMVITNIAKRPSKSPH